MVFIGLKPGLDLGFPIKGALHRATQKRNLYRVHGVYKAFLGDRVSGVCGFMGFRVFGVYEVCRAS